MGTCSVLSQPIISPLSLFQESRKAQRGFPKSLTTHTCWPIDACVVFAFAPCVIIISVCTCVFQLMCVCTCVCMLVLAIADTTN